MSSPPTRGCSASGDPLARRQPVLPADAGVFRPQDRRDADRPRPPRRRGGVPSHGRTIPWCGWSSPPTRGCSDHRPRPGPLRRVLPADAGVFRGPSRPTRTRWRPPRRRGGVPSTFARPNTVLGSSPPTRGCSARRVAASRTCLVLPADAGVFRRRTPRLAISPSPWPPQHAARLFNAQDAGASEQQLRELAGQAFGEVYFRDGGRRAHGLDVEFTDIEQLEIDL